MASPLPSPAFVSSVELCEFHAGKSILGIFKRTRPRRTMSINMVVGSWTTSIALGLVTVLLAYLWKINRAMATTHPEALQISPDRWTPEQVKRTFERVEKQPIDWTPYLPPKLDRRYIVVGGSGLVGGQLVIQLIARGHPPEAIRIIDFRKPGRDDMSEGPVSEVDFAQADISSEPATLSAFAKPWPKSVAHLPLTVFHTAAVIRPSERSPLVYDRCSRVNTSGTAHVVSAAKTAGADVLVFTSSCSVALKPVNFFNALWKQWPTNFFQVLDEVDFQKPLRPHEEFFANYAKTKAEAERLVCGENTIPQDPLQAGGFRTGAIRPGNAIYGHKDDYLVGATVRMASFPTFTAPFMQNWVHGGNVALAHLQYEAALLGPHAHRVAARPFLVTDGGPPPVFQDFYTLVHSISVTPFHVQYPPPLLLLLVAHCIEAYCLLIWRVPMLQKVLPEPQMPLSMLQPASIAGSINAIINDSDARRRVEDGGLGYQAKCTTMEGLCMQLGAWNRWVRSGGGELSGEKGVVKGVLEVGAEPVARRA
ncbi:Putative 3-beta hydroxysteroid dehydrogenase/isomerase, NAD(P)-binding domain superfamily [Colletotrichum destructivum]|uniref:3-beta hydroxysteroid dehydrogenase/isomerase, NAD(P)-binding domain superfamily n=1 Tax=Colletotrichum destructivum TaxID=34406 RepID=A0AAX4IN30_9PEZI|nr:Putative 3-beta hydroxysteroid dehydrogenase/isomerase, NAD(P)-binding domain superfamily [Colletotrichum destructivum]